MNIDYTNTERLPHDGMRMPKEFIPIKRTFEKVMADKTPILLEKKDLKLTHSVVMEVDWVGDYFCNGKVTYYRDTGEIKVPYSINYSEVFTSSFTPTKVIFKGDDPFRTADL